MKRNNKIIYPSLVLLLFLVLALQLASVFLYRTIVSDLNEYNTLQSDLREEIEQVAMLIDIQNEENEEYKQSLPENNELSSCFGQICSDNNEPIEKSSNVMLEEKNSMPIKQENSNEDIVKKQVAVREDIKNEEQIKEEKQEELIDNIDDELQSAVNEKESNELEYKKVMTTLFWVGEGADESNDYISNKQSFWDSYWQESYGGVDSPYNRCGYWPCGFLPKENPFYFALPYADLNSDSKHKESVKNIAWYDTYKNQKTILKNRWIEIVYEDKVCYAQWEDVGPGESDDFDYVFGSAEPKNSFGVSAGLDISPATWDCLGLKTNSLTSWRFLDDSEVPYGPWKDIVTSSGLNYWP